ncbi:hypothetical protein [Pontibacter saemangeumensis]|uniref:hypothetical protein n=1 Tax=Pontibacter saemangeumensis TaxID=1084525 RepID=UPI0031F15DD1
MAFNNRIAATVYIGPGTPQKRIVSETAKIRDIRIYKVRILKGNQCFQKRLLLTFEGKQGFYPAVFRHVPPAKNSLGMCIAGDEGEHLGCRRAGIPTRLAQQEISW